MSLDCWHDCWDERAGGKAVSEVGHADASESYEVDMLHIFQLNNGQWCVVRETGCSCYEYEEADLELFPTLARAFDKYVEFKKTRNLPFTNLEYLEVKSLEKENELSDRN